MEVNKPIQTSERESLKADLTAFSHQSLVMKLAPSHSVPELVSSIKTSLGEPCDTLLAISRHRKDADIVVVKFFVSTGRDAPNRYLYCIALENSRGEIVMNEVHSDFLTACEVHKRLKEIIDVA